MLDDKDFEDFATKMANIVGQINLEFLTGIAKKIKDIKEGNSGTVDAGKFINNLNTKIDNVVKNGVKAISKMLTQVGKKEWDSTKSTFDKAGVKQEQLGIGFVKGYEKDLVNSFKDLVNTNSLGSYTSTKGKKVFTTPRKTYIDIVETALKESLIDGSNVYSAVEKSLNDLAVNGLQTAIFKDTNGKITTQKLEVAVRRNAVDGMRKFAQGIQNHAGEQFDSDGKEISVHRMCAPDHIYLQGRQFTNEEFAKVDGIKLGGATNGGNVVDVNNKDFKIPRRPISIWNCKHYVFNIKLGISTPNYSEEELDKLNKENEDGFTSNSGKHYTLYEATQEMRKIETSIRNLNYQRDLNKTLGTDYKDISKAITRKSKEYYSFVEELKPFGIQAEPERWRIR